MALFVYGEGFNDLQSYIYIGSKVTRFSARFTLVDLGTKMSKDQLKMKKEKSSSSLPPKNLNSDLVVKTSRSQKRKIVESTDLSLESHGAEEVLLKLVSFSQTISIGGILVLSFILPFADLLYPRFRSLITFPPI